MLQVALNMYKGRRRVLVNGAVSSAYQARSGLPAGCRAPNDAPFRTCSWAVVGKGVLIQARLTGPAQSVYRAELLALVTALQASAPNTQV
eukprot:4365935-Amphidinium_carterae.1